MYFRCKIDDILIYSLTQIVFLMIIFLQSRTENEPSSVVHIRSLPTDCSETDVVQLGLPFGKMSNCLLMKQKNQVCIC